MRKARSTKKIDNRLDEILQVTNSSGPVAWPRTLCQVHWRKGAAKV